MRQPFNIHVLWRRRFGYIIRAVLRFDDGCRDLESWKLQRKPIIASRCDEASK